MAKKSQQRQTVSHVGIDELNDLDEAVADLVSKARADEMCGCGDPLDFDLIRAEFETAEIRYKSAVAKVRRVLERRT